MCATNSHLLFMKRKFSFLESPVGKNVGNKSRKQTCNKLKRGGKSLMVKTRRKMGTRPSYENVRAGRSHFSDILSCGVRFKSQDIKSQTEWLLLQ